MRVYVVHPGAAFSTHDVFTGVVAGLAASGADVYQGRLDTVFSYHEAAYRAGVAAGAFRVSAETINLQHWASAHITQHILSVWPDLVLVVSGGNYHTQDVQGLRRAGIRCAVLLTETPYMDVELPMAAQYDVAFTNERSAVPMFRQVQRNTHYLPHAYHPAVHSPAVPPDPAKVCDAVFIGSLFDERRALLDGVNWTGISLTKRGYHLDTGVLDLVPNEEAADYYRSARICLNHHRTTTYHGSGQHITHAESLGPRAYEISACGGFQLMDDSREERHDVFGDCCPTYRAGDSADLERQVRYWLRHDGRREETARAMCAAVQPHSWTHRARQLLEML